MKLYAVTGSLREATEAPRLMSQRYTGILAEVCDIIGPELTDRFTAAFGGYRFYIPRAGTVEPTHKLAVVIGYDAACALSEALSSGKTGAEFEFPRGNSSQYNQERVRRRLLIAECLERGMGNTDIARECGMTRRAVQKHRQRLREEHERYLRRQRVSRTHNGSAQ